MNLQNETQFSAKILKITPTLFCGKTLLSAARNTFYLYPQSPQTTFKHFILLHKIKANLIGRRDEPTFVRIRLVGVTLQGHMGLDLHAHFPLANAIMCQFTPPHGFLPHLS